MSPTFINVHWRCTTAFEDQPVQSHCVTEKAVLLRCIANNYTRIKDVERELGGLQMQLKLSTGPKKSALMMIRKKIELQNERVLAARDRQRAAKKVGYLLLHAASINQNRMLLNRTSQQKYVLQVFETAEEALKAEEQVKERLCQELNLLVQQSAHAQLEKLEQVSLQDRLQDPSFLLNLRNHC